MSSRLPASLVGRFDDSTFLVKDETVVALSELFLPCFGTDIFADSFRADSSGLSSE